MNPKTTGHSCLAGQSLRLPPSRQGTLLRAAALMLGYTVAGCLTPVTTTYKDVTVPVMVGPQVPPNVPVRHVTPLETEVKHVRTIVPGGCGIATKCVQSTESEPAAFGRDLLASAPQCTNCMAHIERIHVGSYTTSLPLDIIIAVTKQWSAVEGSVGERPPATGAEPLKNP